MTRFLEVIRKYSWKYKILTYNYFQQKFYAKNTKAWKIKIDSNLMRITNWSQSVFYDKIFRLHDF